MCMSLCPEFFLGEKNEISPPANSHTAMRMGGTPLFKQHFLDGEDYCRSMTKAKWNAVQLK